MSKLLSFPHLPLVYDTPKRVGHRSRSCPSLHCGRKNLSYIDANNSIRHSQQRLLAQFNRLYGRRTIGGNFKQGVIYFLRLFLNDVDLENVEGDAVEISGLALFVQLSELDEWLKGL